MSFAKNIKNPVVIAQLALAFGLVACNGGSSDSSTSGAGTAGGGGSCSAVRATSHALNSASGPYMAVAESAQGSGPALKKLASHIPHAVAKFSDQGKMDESQQLSITVNLGLNNQDELDQELAAMYQQGSPTYHQFLTTEQFRAKYAPTADQVEQAKSYLISQGVVPTTVDEGQMLIHAAGSAKALNSAFHTEIHNYKDSSGNSYFAPAYEMQADASAPIQGVLGLQNVMKAHGHAVKKTNTGPTKGTGTSQTGTGSGGGYAPADIKTAYSMPAGANGAGQTVAVFELDGFDQSDITEYESTFGLPALAPTVSLVDSATGSAGGGIDEVTLDIEFMLAVAPNVSNMIVYEGENSEQGIIDVYAKIANDNTAKSVSTSWGSSENSLSSADIQSEAAVFAQMAAQGQSIFSAAGDSGADDDGSSLSIDDPSAQPNVTAVGGTTLTTNSDQSYGSETTWTDGGGGVSSTWSIPSYQPASIISAASLGSTSMRNIPDVSINADPATGYAIYVSGGWSTWGGTSAAAPLWAGFTALVNQGRAANGLPGTIGLINPALSGVGQGSSYGSAFHDIKDNSTNGHYPAVQGFDDATGWGTPVGSGLYNALTTGNPGTTPTGPGGGC
jgi:subtilase family serine protease